MVGNVPAGNEFWEARYTAAAASEELVWSLEPNEWIAETVEDLRVGTAVDLGAGEGRNALWLASRGWRVTAVDFSPAGLAIGRARAKENKQEIDWVVADATEWSAQHQVDLVVMAYLQLPAAAAAAALHNALAALAPKGTLALIGHDVDNVKYGTGGPQDIELLYSVEELRLAVVAFNGLGPDEADHVHILECRQFERITADGATAIDAILVARRT